MIPVISRQSMEDGRDAASQDTKQENIRTQPFGVGAIGVEADSRARSTAERPVEPETPFERAWVQTFF
jgi:hypothetical protein